MEPIQQLLTKPTWHEQPEKDNFEISRMTLGYEIKPKTYNPVLKLGQAKEYFNGDLFVHHNSLEHILDYHFDFEQANNREIDGGLLLPSIFNIDKKHCSLTHCDLVTKEVGTNVLKLRLVRLIAVLVTSPKFPVLFKEQKDDVVSGNDTLIMEFKLGFEVAYNFRKDSYENDLRIVLKKTRGRAGSRVASMY